MHKLELTVVPHSHWDREWYLPFQSFRARLVRMIDRLLQIMQHDPAYRYFMLDGQTIVLEDYLEVRPERRAELEALVREGRLLVGPWYVQPDEFLVSGEAIIRNLLRGHQVAASFGAVMKVGYIPDPFGQIGQMPQVLRGFGIDSAVFWRGASDDISSTEFRWRGPDGSEVLTIYMPYGYCNGQPFSFDLPAARRQLAASRAAMQPQANTSHLLLMNGNDHVEPSPSLPATVAALNAEYAGEGLSLRIGTLAQHIAAVRADLGEKELIVHTGEFRWSRRSHILPGVLSSRMWIKQANARLQTLLERAAEPLTAWQWAISAFYPAAVDDLEAATYPAEGENRASRQQAMLRLAWKYLLQNQPHDSICGCGVDEVHEEMRQRYSWGEQIGRELQAESLQALAAQVDTASLGAGVPILVYNHAPARREWLTVRVPLASAQAAFYLSDERGLVAHDASAVQVGTALLTGDLDPVRAIATLTMTADGKVANMILQDVTVSGGDEAGVYEMLITASEVGVPNLAAVAAATRLIDGLAAAGDAHTFRVRASEPAHTTISFMADLPAYGYKTYLLQQAGRPQPSVAVPATVAVAGLGMTSPPAALLPPAPAVQDQAALPSAGWVLAAPVIENDLFRVEADPRTGWLTVRDGAGNVLVEDICLLDSGDAGDEYNYSPPADDQVIAQPLPGSVQIAVSTVGGSQRLRVSQVLELPACLSDDRQSRSSEMVACAASVTVSLYPGVPRIDFETTVDNVAQDHRLRVLFGLPFAAQASQAESAFDIVTRPLGVPAFDDSWIEEPQPTHPQQSFCAASDGRRGVVLANRGLPEYEVSSDGQYSVILLTLLRSVGWLSRADLTTRRGHAGPGLPTPGAQLPGSHTFHYALIPHDGDLVSSRAFEQAHNFVSPPVAAATSIHPGPLPATASLLELEPATLVVSAVKRSAMPVGVTPQAGDRPSLVVRLWNISDAPLDGRLRCHFPFASVGRSNLEETEFAPLSLDGDGWLPLTVGAKEIVTLLFRV